MGAGCLGKFVSKTPPADVVGDGGEVIEVSPLFAEVLAEVDRHKKELGGLCHFTQRPFIEQKVKAKDLASAYSDYEYVYLEVLGLGRLHSRVEEIVSKNNGQEFNKNPGVQLLERVCGMTMHASRDGSNHTLRTAPACLLEAFQIAQKTQSMKKFFKEAFDRKADPCLEGRVDRLMKFIESRGSHLDPGMPHWEDVSLKALPQSSSPQEIVGEHLRVFVAECTWAWSRQVGVTYERAKEVRFDDEHSGGFVQRCNAAKFRASMVSRGVASDACLAKWESAARPGEAQWVPYDADVSDQIEEAWQKSLPSVEVRVGPKSWRYTIDFSQNVQRNPKSGQERSLRRCSRLPSERPGKLSLSELDTQIAFFVELATLPPDPNLEEEPRPSVPPTTHNESFSPRGVSESPPAD